jgi:hypothetical protein
MKQRSAQLLRDVYGRRRGIIVVIGLAVLILLLVPDRPPSISTFSFLNTRTTTYDDVVQIVGRPDRDIGVEVPIFIYEMDDGSELMLQFNSLDKLQASYHYVPETNKCKRLLGKSLGNACGLNFKIEIVQGLLKPEDDVPIRLIFNNIGDEEIIINTRLAPNFHLAPEIYRDILFLIKASSRRDYVPYLLMQIPALQDDDFEVLSPGESLMREMNLEEYYDFSQVGDYTVRAIYLNVSDPGDERVAWKGLITSETVPIRIGE